jgi:hypothetical protein
MAEGLVIPISTPGGEESAAVLDRIADKLEEVGGAAGASATKMGTSANASSAAIGRIATATESTKTAVERLEESGNRGLHALSEKASELAGSMGGAAGKIADVGLKSLAAFGGIGLQATAAVGAVLMLYNAYQQYEAQQRAVTAASEELAAAQTRLGGTYSSLTEAANADGTAEQRVAAIRAASAAIVQEQVATLGRGYTQQETEQITQLSHAIADATRERLGMTAAQVQSVIETGTEAQQQLVLGGAIEHSTNAQVEHANVMVRATRARQHALEVQLEELRARIHGTQGNRSAIGALEDLRAATTQQSAAQRELATATAATAAAESRAADVTREQEGVRIRALAASDATAAALLAAAAVRTGGGSSGPSAQELRAQVEALRMARVANDNAVLSASVERQTAQAREHLTFTTRELALAEASRHDHTRRVTVALQAQSQAQAEYNRSLGAEVAAARARVTAEDALIESQTALRDAAEASLRTGAAQLRQADARSLSMRRAREDAVAANAAAMGGGESAAESAGISTGESARAAMVAAESDATRDLARATQDLAQARREENDASISTEERTTHVTEALARQTTALQRQRAAQAASNAEVQRIKTDRMDFLTNSTKGLADGLVQAGLAAAFAGESVGAALQKQLAASLQALAIEAAQKALFATATGLFQFATGNPAAASSFASAATFAAVAVTAGAIGAAVAPAAAPTTPGAAPGAGRAGDVTPSGAGGMGGGAGAGPIVNNYYAPIVGGRQSTDAETGVRIDRYNDAARARLRRAA